MPRPLVYGNGRCLIQIDREYRIRDLFYPQVGRFNHVAGHACRMGLWVSGHFEWVDAKGWTRTFSYEPQTLVGRVQLEHEGLGIRLEIREALHPVHPVFVRRIEIHNLRSEGREVRLFFTQDLRIAETDIGDTALYHGPSDSVIHYKGGFAFLFGAQAEGQGIYEYTHGIKAFKNLVGTWLDAEDGHLHMIPIAQGSVDSTFSVRAQLSGNGQALANFWMLCADSLEDAVDKRTRWLGTDPERVLNRADATWRSWLHTPKDDPRPELDLEVQAFVERSLLIVRTQIDNEGGILAANDSDIMETNRATYSFIWPRDGALVASVLDEAGQTELTRRYFEFCERIMPRDRPMFRHKYGPDGSLGASWHPWTDTHAPIQEDETALTVLALDDHYRAAGDIERIARWYPRLIEAPCNAMSEFVDPSTGLPLPSWDLWEERFGIHAYTTASVIAGLRAGARLARHLGEDPAGRRWAEVADQMQHAALDHLWDDERGVFFRMLQDDGTPDRTLDSATLAFGLLGAIPSSDPRIARNAATLEEGLSIRTPIGGIARYERDYYFRKTDAYPGNPWVICTMWMAQTKALLAQSRDDLKVVLDSVRWAMRRAESTGVLAEQFHPETGEPLSVSPLTWSHVEVIRTVQHVAKRWSEFQ